MAFITLSTEHPVRPMGWDELEFHTEDAGAEGAMLTIVGRHSDIVRWLATVWAVNDDTGLNWLVNQIQLEDSSMNEHNAVASAVGL